MLQPPVLKTSKLVVGHSLQALRFALENSAMLLLNHELKPHSIEQPSQHDEWNVLSFRLGLRGLSPIPSAVRSIRIDERIANVATEFYRKIQIKFEQLYLFDLERVEGLPVKENIMEYVVYDWFNIKRGAKQPSCSILGSDKFINKVVFYPSVRRDGNTGLIKDCYTKSYVEGKNLMEFDYCATVVRLGTAAAIKNMGFKGPARHINGKQHNLNLVLEHDRREVFKHRKEFIGHDLLPSYIKCCNISI